MRKKITGGGMPINGEVNGAHGEVGFSSNSSLNQISLYRELFRPLSTNEAKDFFYIPFFIKVLDELPS